MGQNILQTAGTTALSTFDRLVYFKSSNAVKQVVDLLGEETIMNALVLNSYEINLRIIRMNLLLKLIL